MLEIINSLNWVDYFQLCGGTAVSLAYIPQVIQIFRTKSVKDLSLKSFLIVFCGLFLMELYTINMVLYKNAGHTFLFTNSMAFITIGIIVSLIFKFRKRH